MEIITMENNIKKTEAVLNNIIKLHSIPRILAEILEYLNTESVNNTKLSKMILGDQSLATKILVIANSPLYGLHRNVTTIDFAVMVLGVDEIRNIVSSLTLMDTFKNKSDEYLDQGKFWQHSFLVGSVAKRIAEDLSLSYAGEVFTAGFLHDIGLPVIHKYFHSAFVKIMNDVESRGTNYISAEIDNIGLSHCEIAYKVLDKWNLPVILCDITKHHHAPTKSEDFSKQAAIVHLADFTTKHLNIGSYFWDNDLQLDMNALSVLGFNDEEKVIHQIEKYTDVLNAQLEATRHLV